MDFEVLIQNYGKGNKPFLCKYYNCFFFLFVWFYNFEGIKILAIKNSFLCPDQTDIYFVKVEGGIFKSFGLIL